MANCVGCGTASGPGDRFCRGCGAALPPETTAGVPLAPPPASWAPPPAAWAPPPGQYGPSGGLQQTTNGLAIASMVLGIIWIYWLGSILALVLGYIAKKQIDQSQGRQGGRSMAVAGIVLGWIGVGILALVLVLVLASRASSSSNY